MKTTNNTPTVKRISAYTFTGFLGLSGIGQAIATDENGRKVANLLHHPEKGYQAETPAMSYATDWHPTEAAALRALFASGEWAYFGNAKTATPAANGAQHLDPISRAACRWMERHPRTTSALLWLQAAALAYIVYNYNFTTL